MMLLTTYLAIAAIVAVLAFLLLRTPSRAVAVCWFDTHTLPDAFIAGCIGILWPLCIIGVVAGLLLELPAFLWERGSE